MKAAIDKCTLLEKAQKALNEKAERSDEIAQGFSKDATKWPSAKESHSDTNRSQLQHMSLAAKKMALDIQLNSVGAIDNMVKNLHVPHEIIGFGSLVSLQYEDDEEIMIAFIVPGKNSTEIELDEQIIFVLPEQAALAKAILGKKCGDKAVIKTGLRELTVNILAVE
ncbi:hypothetical protein COZ22_04210 [bacterium (Candidatus Howlettbacteria) CG_4_10_14_3_um_filter_37_10]|nr:MAG: hypothetical protein COX25_02820 [bacterium (Candidatus Howlettbacteria) CG23_combo_of_CG06-09_8_20_14_all_37_9]PIX98754.1 MAG: hypothetical protein COZ22_04210 [bacterium (Candidatus Howlettbacteria) CG_4_10_14_3_um_filter_37_10]PJB06379.1 MAG: hypothetical protein CO123_02330 [bacterium (Candidatus Howlettbacteria) CG_4_9_14_3_um_filter_37_10]